MLPSAAKPFTASTALSVLYAHRQVKTVSVLSQSMHLMRWIYAQSKDLWRIARLNVETLCLTRVSSDDGEVCTSNRQNCPAILGVGVKRRHLRRCCCCCTRRHGMGVVRGSWGLHNGWSCARHESDGGRDERDLARARKGQKGKGTEEGKGGKGDMRARG